MTEKGEASTSPKGGSPSRARVSSASPKAQAGPSPPKGPTPKESTPAANEEEDAQPPLEADDVSSVEGYETGSDGSSSLATSIASSTRDYNFENRRRYHKFKEGQYHFPNDDPEQEREDMKHHMVVALCGDKLHNAPLKNPQKVLDIGTGTGIWAIEMGETYPEAEIEGLDLSPIQPPFVPGNVKFTVDDVEADWLYPENSLDYVHLRHMAPSIKDWPKLLSQAYKALKPGGWLEIQEMLWKYTCDDGTMPPGQEYAPAKMTDLIKDGLANFGVDVRAGNSHGERIEAAGFQNLVHDIKKVPVGIWPKDAYLKSIGDYCRAVIYDGLHAVTIGPLTKGLGWTALEVEVFLVQVRKEMMNDDIHSYVFYHSYSGQKPLNKE